MVIINAGTILGNAYHNGISKHLVKHELLVLLAHLSAELYKKYSQYVLTRNTSLKPYTQISLLSCPSVCLVIKTRFINEKSSDEIKQCFLSSEKLEPSGNDSLDVF